MKRGAYDWLLDGLREEVAQRRAAPVAVLGLTPGYSDGELRRAYRLKVLETHPDRGGSNEALRAVTDAYQALRATP